MLKTTVIISSGHMERYPLVVAMVRILQKGTLPPDEIIVVTNPGELYEKMREISGVTVYITDSKTPMGSRYTGISKANNDIIAFLDDDEIPESTWLEKIADAHIQGSIVVGGRIRLLYGEPKWLAEEFYWLIGITAFTGNEIRNPYGGNMSILKSALGRIQIDDDFIKLDLQGEEMALCTRIEKEFGRKATYAPDAVVYHIPPSRKMKYVYLLKRSYNQGRHKKRAKNRGYILEGEKNALITIRKNLVRYVTSPAKLFSSLTFTLAVIIGYLVG
jgi:glycosyltransferase involved in cell wall biosynthesis